MGLNEEIEEIKKEIKNLKINKSQWDIIENYKQKNKRKDIVIAFLLLLLFFIFVMYIAS